MTTYFKATRMDGTDFYSGKIDYAAALAAGTTIKHPHPSRVGSSDARGYLSVATVSTDCTGFSWPARLFAVESVNEEWAPGEGLPNKRATHELRVVGEIPADMLFGPQGEACIAIIDQFTALPEPDKYRLRDAQTDEWWAAYDRVWAVAYDGRTDRAGLFAARRALRGRLFGWDGGDSAYGAALAVLCRHLIGTEVTRQDYDAATAPWREVVGSAHPDDTLATIAIS